MIASLLSGCSLMPQQGENNCPAVEIVELPIAVQTCPEPQIVERISHQNSFRAAAANGQHRRQSCTYQ